MGEKLKRRGKREGKNEGDRRTKIEMSEEKVRGTKERGGKSTRVPVEGKS